VAQRLAQALIALRAYRSPVYARAAGSAVLLAALALPLSLEARVSVALLCGGGVGVMAGLLLRALHAVPSVTGRAAG
jgi:hypothetical protein